MSDGPRLPLGVIEWPSEAPGVIVEPTGGGGGSFSGTFTFYASSTSGGATDVLNTVTILLGLVTNWTQAGPSGTPGEWLFDDAVNSGQYLTIGF